MAFLFILTVIWVINPKQEETIMTMKLSNFNGTMSVLQSERYAVNYKWTRSKLFTNRGPVQISRLQQFPDNPQCLIPFPQHSEWVKSNLRRHVCVRSSRISSTWTCRGFLAPFMGYIYMIEMLQPKCRVWWRKYNTICGHGRTHNFHQLGLEEVNVGKEDWRWYPENLHSLWLTNL